MKERGIFITLEGGEGSGKSTQAERLTAYLKELGYETVRTQEPGGTQIGDQIRQILLNPASRGMSAYTELFLFLASRAQLVEDVIKPALAENKTVICDRYIDSSIAYQGYGRELDLNLVWELNKIATGGLLPDLTLYFDMLAESGLARKAKNSSSPLDRLELEEISFHQRVRKGYLELVRAYPERIKLIPVEVDPEHTFLLVKQEVDKLLQKIKRN